MQPLFSVHNNVSLLSVTIAPSSFLAALIVAFVFLSLYLPRLPNLPRFLRFGRRTEKQGTNDNCTSSSQSKAIVLQRNRYFVRTPQGLLEVDGFDDNDNGSDSFNTGYQFWSRPGDRGGRNDRELEYVDRRHLPLPPLPRALQDAEGPRPEKTKKAEKEALRLKAKQQQKSSKSSKIPKSFKNSSSSSSIAPSLPWQAQNTVVTTTASAELVLHRHGRNENPSRSQQVGSSNQNDTTFTVTDTTDIRTTADDGADPTSWAPFATAADAFGRLFAARFRPNPEPSNHLPPSLPSLHHPNICETDRHAMAASEIASEVASETGTGTGIGIGTESMPDSDCSVGGYSPPAWRRLGNGDRSSGFWRKSDNILGSPPPSPTPPHRARVSTAPSRYQRRSGLGISDAGRLRTSRESSPGFDSADDEIVNEILGLDDEEYTYTGLRVGYNPYGGNVDNVLEQAMRTRLPGSTSPEIERSPEPWSTGDNNYNRNSTAHRGSLDMDEKEMLENQEVVDNYIRFAVRNEVQPRTSLVEWVVACVHSQIYLVRQATRTWGHVVGSVLLGIVSLAVVRAITQPAGLGLLPVPDLVKVAGVARSFEPLIYYSENAVAQVGDLQATGAAVWDLGESVRHSNLTSAPLIVKELDDLSETLNVLAMELTRFFANVDSDIDGILIVMDWVRRELSRLTDAPSGDSSSSSVASSYSSSMPPAPAGSSSSSSLSLFRPLTALYDHLHTLLSSAGLLEDAVTGAPTAAGAVATTLFGMSGPQRTRATLRRTFNEFLSVLEEAVSSELQHSLALFALFEAIDRQFLNLKRTVVREALSVENAWDAEEEAASTLLARLWTRLLGDNPQHTAAARKYEQNRELLRSVREKTVQNKSILMAHNNRLLTLKASLESLRRKLVSPLVRSVNSNTLSLEEQIRGLEDVGGYLEGVRARQKGKLLEIMYGAGSVGGSDNTSGQD